MKTRFLNLLLIGSIVSSVMLSSCKKDNDNEGTTLPPTNETGTFTDSRDNKTYQWVKIGEQIWMAENLAYTGSGIQHITENSEWENNSDYDGWCYYENNESYGNTYGVLYQWEAAKTAYPSGWHLPTNEEWTQLENYLIENGYSYDGVVGNLGIAKSLATDNGWSISDNQGAVGNDDFPEFRNKTGFSALSSGGRYREGVFTDLNSLGFMWSATEGDSTGVSCRALCYTQSKVGHGDNCKFFGFSVRCVKD